MKPERAFVAERALAQHCAELIRPAPEVAELLSRLDASATRLCDALSAVLAPLTGGEPPSVTPDSAQPRAAVGLAELMPSLASWALFPVGKIAAPLLIAVDGSAVLRMVDRAFGGRGTAPDPLPDGFPLSAELMIARIEKLVLGALDSAWQLGGSMAPASTERDSVAAKLPIPAGQLAVQRCTVIEAGGAQWPLLVALPVSALAETMGQGGNAGPSTPRTRADPNPADAPYGSLPFALSAVLVDMALPVSAISALAPGQVLPVSVARNVPLRIGNRTLAHGTIGALDERVAVQITQAF